MIVPSTIKKKPMLTEQNRRLPAWRRDRSCLSPALSGTDDVNKKRTAVFRSYLSGLISASARHR
jgi:hypothetical protein